MSLPTLPPMRVPTLTEVVDWPLAQVVVGEASSPAQTDGHAEDAVVVCVDETSEPTMTEAVIEQPKELTPALSDVPTNDAPVHEPTLPPPLDEAALTQRILADLQHHVDSMLDHQLRVAMQPLLNRLADTLARQTRDELASALRDMVALAVSREMIRLRAEAPRSDSA
ncbi:MAG: hypothetical protein WCJ87_08440 [Burkholderiales bacterium]